MPCSLHACLSSILNKISAGTFKIRKLDLVREGYNPTVVSDPLFFYNSAVGTYCELDTCLYEDIVSMRCRL
jgi:hypothetical protein